MPETGNVQIHLCQGCLEEAGDIIARRMLWQGWCASIMLSYVDGSLTPHMSSSWRCM